VSNVIESVNNVDDTQGSGERDPKGHKREKALIGPRRKLVPRHFATIVRLGLSSYTSPNFDHGNHVTIRSTGVRVAAGPLRSWQGQALPRDRQS
jgi:hypothetical protein